MSFDMIIVMANSKGGVGKSTLSVHLATWLDEQGHSVILADCDAQHSSSEWMRESAPAVRSVKLDSPDKILDALPKLAQEADFVIADGPGSNSEISRAWFRGHHRNSGSGDRFRGSGDTIRVPGTPCATLLCGFHMGFRGQGSGDTIRNSPLWVPHRPVLCRGKASISAKLAGILAAELWRPALAESDREARQ